MLETKSGKEIKRKKDTGTSSGELKYINTKTRFKFCFFNIEKSVAKITCRFSGVLWSIGESFALRKDLGEKWQNCYEFGKF